MSEEIVNLIVELNENEAIGLIQAELNSGADPFKILEKVRIAMGEIGKRYENHEYFLADLMMSGEILRHVSEILEPHLKKDTKIESIAKIVLGTVEGDLHDIGKNIVKFMLETNGFEVHDLGIDVPSEKFIEKAKEINPDIIALSGFLTLAYDSMKKTVEAIDNAGLRDKTKIMIGGGQIDDSIKEYVGADAYGKDALEAVALARKWAGVA